MASYQALTVVVTVILVLLWYPQMSLAGDCTCNKACHCYKTSRLLCYRDENGNGYTPDAFCSTLKFEADECSIPNRYYAYGGFPCSNWHGHKGQTGKCTPIRSFGVNLGSHAYEVTDKFGIKYKPTSAPGHAYQTNTNVAPFSRTSVLGEDPRLFDEGIETYGSRHKQGCVWWNIDADSDGWYAVTVMMRETYCYTNSRDYDVRRAFNVKLNGMTALKELDIGRLDTNDWVTQPHHIVISYKISRRRLYLKGHDTSTSVSGGKVKLEFCDSKCGSCGGARLNAFSAVQYTRSVSSPPPPPPSPPSNPPPAPPSDWYCTEAGTKPYKCKGYDDCRFNIRTGRCEHHNKVCFPFRNFIKGRRCSSTGLRWEAFNGAGCRAVSQGGTQNCFALSVEAWNFGGSGLRATNGIRYAAALEKNEFHDNHRIDTVSGVAGPDQPLYSSMFLAKRGSKSGCSSQFFYVGFDADYELHLKMVEPKYTERRKRSFTVKLAGLEILKNFDILTLAKYRGEAVDIIQTFTVSNRKSTLTLSDGRSNYLSYQKVTVEFCHGDDGSPDSGYAISALHVLRWTDSNDANALNVILVKRY